MAADWRAVLGFAETANPGFNEVYTRYRRLVREAVDAETERRLVNAYEAARKELGAKPSGSPAV
jgi:hypothetical protein